MRSLTLLGCLVFVASCASPEGKGLMPTPVGTGAAVKFDAFARPLPEVPLPNDFATRFDATSPTKRRVNASMLAPTKWEQGTRKEIDHLDGWGTYQTITVGFDKTLDLQNIVKRHQGDDYDPSDDVAYLMGGGYMSTWVVPSQDLVILRWGFEPPKELGWDHSMVPNLLRADLLKRKR